MWFCKGWFNSGYCLCIISLILCFGSGVSFAQVQDRSSYVSYQLLRMEEGLASREVLCGLQDRQGFMWFGTRNGLNRYDGINFRYYSKRKSGLQDSRIVQMAHDSSGMLWLLYGKSGYNCISSGKVDLFDPLTQTPRSLREKFPDLPFAEKDVLWLTGNSRGEVFIITRPFRIYVYNAASGFKLLCEDKKTPYPEFANTSHFVTSNALWISFDSTVCYYAAGKRALIGEQNGQPVDILCLLPDGSAIARNGMPRGDKSAIRIYNNGKTGQPGYVDEGLKKLLAEHNYYDILPDAVNGSSVLLGASGLFSVQLGKLHTLLDATELEKHPGLKLFSVFTDRHGWRWLCTNQGVMVIKEKPLHFSHYATHRQVKNELYGTNQARGIYVDPAGQLYINMWDQLMVCDTATDTYKGLVTEGPELTYATLASGNSVYIGAYRLYEKEIGAKDGLRQLFRKQVKEIWSLHKSNAQTLLLGTSKGIYRYDLQDHTLSPCVVTGKTEADTPAFVYAIKAMRGGQIWAAAEQGLYRLDPDGKVLEYYGSYAEDPANMVQFSDLHDVFEDANGIFWVATNGSGLIRWDRRQNKSTQYGMMNGLSSNLIYGILQDEKGKLWLSSDYGLMCFDTATGKVKTYTTRDGLSHNEFNRVSSYKAADGRMYFGGMDGVNAFYPSQLWTDSTHFDAPLRIVSYSKYNGLQGTIEDLTLDLQQSGTITLQPGDRFFILGFVLLDYETEQHKYAYMIEGIDKEWNELTENTLRLSGLPYGDYVLRIKAQSQSGEWSSGQVLLQLHVLRPFYRNPWFILTVVLIGILLMYTLIQIRTRQHERDKQILEKMVGERTTALRKSLEKTELLLDEKDVLMKEIHHRVKNNLQVISGLLELQFSELKDEKAKAAAMEGRNRVRAIALIHQQLYRQENVSAIELHTFVTELHAQIASIYGRREQQVSVQIDVPVSYLDIDTAVPLGLMLNELITNAYKYAFTDGKGGKLEINVRSLNPGEYQLRVSDTGHGLPDETKLNKPKSLGIQLLNWLSKQLGGSVSYEFDNGSVFTIHFKDTAARNKQE